MPKENLLDRLAGAMKTLNKRQAKNLTPRQRVAAAQRWNSLAGIGEDEAGRLYRLAEENATQPGVPNNDDLGEWGDFNDALVEMGIRERVGGFNADNPFLSDNIIKYAEQSDFLDWCRYNRLEPNGRNLKTFRWEKYKGMSVPQRERIYYNYDNHFLPEEKMWRGRNDMPDYLPVGWSEELEF